MSTESSGEMNSPPENANEGCVGPTSQSAGTASACAGCPNQSACASGTFNSPDVLARMDAETQALRQNLSSVSHVVLVLSGKGGVGKSTVSAQLAQTLATQGFAVGLLDIDLTGPSAPRMLLGDSWTAQSIHKSGSGAWVPVYTPATQVAVMSISFMMEDPQNTAVIWKGPKKTALIQQFLAQTDWTATTDGLDYLVVDTPPGTSDEHIAVVQKLQKADVVAGAVMVTTPEQVSLSDVRKELSFCRKTNLPVLGVVENMGQYQAKLDDLQFLDDKGEDKTKEMMDLIRQHCPQILDCHVSTKLFDTSANSTASNNGISGAQAMAEEFGVPFWGRLPMDPELLQACEQGQALTLTNPNSLSANILKSFADKLAQRLPVAMEVEG